MEKLIICLLFFIFLFTHTTHAQDVKEGLIDAGDCGNPPLTSCIIDLYEQGIISGDGNGYFHPNRIITNAEFTSMLAKREELLSKEEDYFKYFTLEPGEITKYRLERYGIKPEDWYYDAYYTTVRARRNTLLIYRDYTKFDPNAPILIIDAFIMASKRGHSFNTYYIEDESSEDFLNAIKELNDSDRKKLDYSLSRIHEYGDEGEKSSLFGVLSYYPFYSSSHKDIPDVSNIDMLIKAGETMTRAEAAFLLKYSR